MARSNEEKALLYHRILRLGGMGILSYEEAKSTGIAVIRVLAYMLDMQWHDAHQIRCAAGKNGTPASEGLRRLRELRDLGFEVEREKVAEERSTWRYRLKLPERNGVPQGEPPTQKTLWGQGVTDDGE